jgi:hypothetical protein
MDLRRYRHVKVPQSNGFRQAKDASTTLLLDSHRTIPQGRLQWRPMGFQIARLTVDIKTTSFFPRVHTAVTDILSCPTNPTRMLVMSF